MADDLPDWTSLLQDGASNPGSPWRNIALGTLGLDGAPQIRTVVLRRFAPWTLDIHTDTRSAKHAELAAHPAATVHCWDPASRIQLRASGLASLHTGDAVAQDSWAALRPATRATYCVMPGPGTPLAGPDNPTPDAADGQARTVFCVVRLAIQTVDWLYLGQQGLRRARFTSAGTVQWLVP